MNAPWCMRSQDFFGRRGFGWYIESHRINLEDRLVPDGRSIQYQRLPAEFYRGFEFCASQLDDLGAACGIRRASLNRSFREITALSPLQYQKQLRLLEARRLLIGGEHNVSGAAFAVGYKCASQFSRDYLRHFEASPSQDLRRTVQASSGA